MKIQFNNKEAVLKVVENIISNKKINEDEEMEFFYDVLLNVVNTISRKIISSNFYSIPISYEDLTSRFYFSYKTMIYNFRKDKLSPSKFIGYYLRVVRFDTINVCRSYLTNGHLILNNYINDEDDTKFQYENKSLHIFWAIYSLLTEFQKKIYLLKWKGYSNNEICIILKCNISKVAQATKQIKNNKNARYLLNKYK